MNEELPLVHIQGPPNPGASSQPFWEIFAVAPEFGLDNVEPEKEGVQEDRVHPIRTLLLDPGETELEGRRLPRLLSMHVLTGQIGVFDANRKSEKLVVRLTKDAVLERPASRTATPGSGPIPIPIYRSFDASKPERAGFYHVSLEPVLGGSKEWPSLDGEKIRVPSFRLMTGAVELLADHDAFDWLGPLRLKVQEEIAGRDAIRFRLTPDGIELDAEVGFPGHTGKLRGRFVLLPTKTNPRLRLLPDRLEGQSLTDWRAAWGAVTPASDEAEQAVSGLKVDARRDGPPPAFTWSTKLDGGEIDGLSPEVEVPAEALTVRLLSPEGPNGIDGEVTLKPEAYKLATFDAKLAPDSIESVVTVWNPKPKVMLSAEMKPAVAPKFDTQLVLDATKDAVAVRLVPIGSAKGHVCAHDERALAAALRASYGLEELTPGRLDDKRPLLAAFVPLDDGWLQLPVPNFPPLDLSTDVDRVPFVQPSPNVLSGYLRYAQTGTLPPVLSAFQKEPGLAVKEVPWVITVEGTQRLAMVIGIDTDGKVATLVRFAAALDNPELSTRGLVWISADRPDEFEALPRLGAGAGAYFDLPLETFDIEEKPAVQLTITNLKLKVEKGALTREELGLAYAFDAEQPDWKELAAEGKDAIAAAQKVLGGSMNPLPPVLWRRHPRMPFAAAMPMTRGAGSSVRPLESRDLVPFTAEVAAGKSLRMEWSKDAAFPKVTSLRLGPVQEWPWPKKGKEEPHPQGIALAAFGVPGAEVALGDDKSFADDPWTSLRCALRYDLPALDEAFATAALPPVPPEEALPEEREAPPPVPVPLAYDWPAMQGFWDDQNRRHQLARVAHSYLAPYREPGVKQEAVRNLVGGLKWETRLGFEIAAAAEPLPYGKATIDQTATGNEALLGVSGSFHKEGADKLVKGGDEIQVVGFSPSSYKEDGFMMDSRRTGLKPMERVGDRLLLRPVRIAVPGGSDGSAGVNGLATLLRPVAVDNLFSFWFKDLPLAGEKLVPLPDTTGFDAWQDGRLPLSGFEWRLISVTDEPGIFERGRDRIPFFGFAFEPLRLQTCTVRGGFVQDATILARLHLGPLRAGAPPDGNLVTLGLAKKDDALTITSLQDKAGLRFVLEEMTGLESRAVVSTGCSWDKGLKLKEGSVALEMFGEERTFTGAKLLAEAAGVTISWSPKKPVATLLPGKGAVAVDSINLRVAAPKGEVTGALARRILLAPRAELESTQEVPPPITVTLKNAGVETVSLLGLKLPKDNAAFKERTGAFTLTLQGPAEGSILPGFPVKGMLAAGLMARTSPAADDGRIDLPAGYLDGEIATTPVSGAPMALERVTFSADCRRRPALTDWRGALRFQGRLSIDNAIGWPAIDKGGEVDPNIPWPGVDANGRTKVKILAKTACTHRVDYVLDGHALPFDLAARVLVPGSNALWTVPAVSTHTLTLPDGTKKASFTAVETIAIGAAEAIVPKPVAPDDKSDLVTFAPRFMEVVEKGKPKDREPGMVKAGAGRAGTVLRGALGMPFRRAFWQANPTGLFLAGGFAGLLAERDGFPAPLIRLPVLAPLVKQDLGTPGLIAQHDHAEQTIEIAWADGRAARNVAATLRGAVMPASASDAALRSALLAGSRPAAIPGLTPEETVAAVLVEQSFVVKWNETFPVPDLKTQPFFLAAAVSVARALKQLESATAPLVLSLVAGYGVEEKKSRSLAAALLTRSLPPEEEKESLRRRLRSELATLGDEVAVAPWTGPAVADLGEVVPVGLVAGPAFADHPQPRAVVLRTVNGEGTLRYDVPPLPRPRERARFTPPLADANRAYADAGRGFGLTPDDGTAPLRWLAGPEEGPMQPFRDDAGTEASGLAGMSRVMALPAHAADVEAGAMASRLVWVAQTRAPIYLDLPLKEVKTPPVPWLTPATPRARLPVDDVVAEILKIPNALGPQAFLPDAATVASVGDRAGISLARIARCETSVSAFSAFDDRHARFGRPAQGGAWSVRTERTPRPGPLPENRGDLERDRRPCATPLLASVPLHALVGSADTVSGEPNQSIGRWSVTFVAAPEWQGLVTERWDGTISLLAEVDVEDPEKKLTDPAATLFGLLFPKDFPARASLVIGKVVVPFLRLHLQKAGTFQDLADGIRRGVVALVLDARPGDKSPNPGPALGAIAEALSVVPLPPVEVRLLVHPDSRPQLTPGAVTDLKVDDDKASLAEGEGRAPVVLRFPLSPVVRSRGALPLVPASVLFMDPAYNAGLSSAPAEDRQRVSAPGAPLTPGRGALFAVLYADRARVNRKASITFMMDLAFEKKLDLRARLTANGNGADGDIVTSKGAFLLRLEVIPKDGARRDLFIGKPAPAPVPGFKPPDQPQVSLAHVYELPLSNVVETDGTAAAFVAGDMLVLEVGEKETVTVTAEVLGDQPDLSDKVKIDKLHDIAVSRTLRIVLTDEPVVEPPSALYAALVRRTDQDEQAALVPGRLSLPLYAQSPLPWRVDLRDAKADFRRGLMRRSATFVWTLARPAAEQQRTGIHVVKVDRNGQTFLPPASTATPEEMSKLFVKPRIPGDPKLS